MSWIPVVGHENVLRQARRALERGRLGHAFLFVGPEGVGKRRVARHIAQGLLCETRPAHLLDPCGQCAGCRQVQTDSHPDYFEVAKPADKNELPIPVIQDLCGRLSLKPARGGNKVAILDDADYLNEEAANAFLKTLEEPPPASILILLATSAEAQLATIVSRCQVLRFRELSDAAITGLLIQLGVTADRAEAARLAVLGGGSVGQAVELAAPEWRAIHERLSTDLRRLPHSSLELTQELQRFIEEAGKEAAPRRARARQVVRLAAHHLSDVLSAAVGGAEDDTLGKRLFGTEVEHALDPIMDMIDRCLAADYEIGRFLHLTLLVDCWMDDLAQIATGNYVPVLGAT